MSDTWRRLFLTLAESFKAYSISRFCADGYLYYYRAIKQPKQHTQTPPLNLHFTEKCWKWMRQILGLYSYFWECCQSLILLSPPKKKKKYNWWNNYELCTTGKGKPKCSVKNKHYRKILVSNIRQIWVKRNPADKFQVLIPLPNISETSWWWSIVGQTKRSALYMN